METALLLVEPYETGAAIRLERLLALFGVASRTISTAEFPAAAHAVAAGSCRLLATAVAFLKLAELMGQNSAVAAGWSRTMHSAFVFTGGESATFEQLARLLTGDPHAALVRASGGEWRVSDQMDDFCRSMSGIQTPVASSRDLAFVLDESKTRATGIISSPSGRAFFRVDHRSVPVFLSTGEVIDVEAPPASRSLDVRLHFIAAVPVVMYVKWAFAGICWEPPRTSACLVIDDPVLKPRYGFLNFQNLVRLMNRVNFSTSVAFIPWNWNRSSGDTVQLFRENSRRLSISIHGCDHTGGEFGGRNAGRVAWKSREAMQRMTRHQSKTGLPYDAVMVFPQGVFSETAMSVLKHEEFIGVVNTEVISVDDPLRPVRIADCWSPAVMNYSDCAIFTRRYPWHGLENFAFDILLGKSCIAVVHHNDCYDDCRHLGEFIGQLNGLNVRLVWGNLGDVVRHSYRWRELAPGVVDVEMFGREILLENPAPEKKLFRVAKQESMPAVVQEVRAGERSLPWNSDGSRVAFELELGPGEIKTVSIRFSPAAINGFKGENLKYRVKTMLRRYLCEVRDNFLTRKPAAADSP